jgi:hypothetical protein
VSPEAMGKLKSGVTAIREDTSRVLRRLHRSAQGVRSTLRSIPRMALALNRKVNIGR